MKKNGLFQFVVFIVFFCLYVIFLITHYQNNLSLFFDIPSMFFASIFDFDNPDRHYFMFKTNDSVRFFSNFLLVLPFNLIGVTFLKNSILSLANSFSLSYLLMHFIALIVNVIVARRTKRYDIAVIAFTFYVIFSLPNIIWVVREVHFAVLLYFPLLSYFLTRVELTKKDIVPILLLVVYLFESFEITFVYGIILFFFLHLYSKKEDVKNIWFKILIGFGGLCASVYIPLKLIYLVVSKSLMFTEALGPQEWINGSIIAISTIFQSNLIIFLFALISLVFAFYYKKEYDCKSLFFFCPLFLLLLIVLYKQTGLYPSVNLELHNYSIVFWFIFPIIFTVILLDCLNVEIKKYFISNLFIVACLFGSINLGWQIHSNIEFGKYIKSAKETVNNSYGVITSFSEDVYSTTRHINSYSTCFSTMPASILFSENKKVEKVLAPQEYYQDYSQWCFYNPEYTYYDEINDILHIQAAMIKPQSSLLDMTNIVEEFKNKGYVKP